MKLTREIISYTMLLCHFSIISERNYHIICYYLKPDIKLSPDGVINLQFKVLKMSRGIIEQKYLSLLLYQVHVETVVDFI